MTRWPVTTTMNGARLNNETTIFLVNKQKRILIVEDSDLQREICIHQLKESGFTNISSARNGAEAISFLKKNPIDIVISDWDMPQLNGVELLKKVKSDPQLKKIPFLILAVNKDTEKNVEALKLGAFAYITKPSSPAMLDERIQYIFSSKREKSSDRRQGTRRVGGERRNPENDRRD